MLTIVHLITALGTGGAESMLVRLAGRGDRGRFRTVVVSMTDAGAAAAASLATAGVELRCLGLRRGLPDPRGLSRLRRILRELRPDILQSWLYHADLLALAATRSAPVRRLVWNLRCTDMEDLSPLAALSRRLLARASPLPDAVIVNSAAGRDFHQRLGYRPRRWQYLPNGFDTAELRPDPERRVRSRAALGVAPEAIVIGMAARWHPMKDHDNFLAAAARFAALWPQAAFVLAGPGVEAGNRPLVEALARRGLEGRVKLLGERGDMACLYPAFDIATLSSAWGEGFPNVLGEAMACGVPCVATDRGDAADLVAGSGIAVPPRDDAALAAGWDRLAALGPEGRQSLGERARAQIAARYELADIVGRYEAFYEEIAARSALAARWAKRAVTAE
jgi:glycosyltransferase involved in cell wall biosynthesis